MILSVGLNVVFGGAHYCCGWGSMKLWAEHNTVEGGT